MSVDCKTCNRPLLRRNKSGYCAAHVHAARAADPAWRAKLSASIQYKMAHDPEFREKKRAQGRALSAVPDIVARRTAHFDQRIRNIGHQAALAPEVRARAGRSLTDSRLAWCPAHLRAEYLTLVRTHLCTAAEARKMIEDQNELEMARWRRSMGVADDNGEIAALVVALRTRNFTPTERAIQAAAAMFDVSEKDILSANRARHISIARYALAATFKRAGMTLMQVAAALGRNDHSTALHLIRRAEWFAAHDPKFAAKMAHVAVAWDGDLQVAA